MSVRVLAAVVVPLVCAVLLGTLGRLAQAATPTPPPRVPTAAGPVTFTVSCDNGSSYTREIAGDGSTTIEALPAGTRCTAAQQPVGPRQVAPPIPGGGQVRLEFAAPSLALTPALGRPRFTTQVAGSDFPPGATVSLAWSAGRGGTTLVVADAAGGFVAHVLVLPGDPLGPRQMVATTEGVSPVAADYVVVPNPLSPAGSDRTPVFGR